MKMMPPISKFMTPMPHTIGHEISIKTAFAMMREYRIRHLPVQDAGQLVGILTDRDAKLALSFGKADDLLTRDVMTEDPYTIEPEMPVAEVVKEMASHKYGCAVVRQRNGKIVGIFTATDALRVLHETLETFYRPSPEIGLYSRG